MACGTFIQFSCLSGQKTHTHTNVQHDKSLATTKKPYASHSSHTKHRNLMCDTRHRTYHMIRCQMDGKSIVSYVVDAWMCVCNVYVCLPHSTYVCSVHSLQPPACFVDTHLLLYCHRSIFKILEFIECQRRWSYILIWVRYIGISIVSIRNPVYRHTKKHSMWSWLIFKLHRV